MATDYATATRIFIKSLLLFPLIAISAEELGKSTNPCMQESKTFCEVGRSKRYLLYEVNPGEGFNLRRDVYIRIAPLIHSLNVAEKSSRWILVLPPWGMLPHWKHWDSISNRYLDWGTFFDLTEMRKYIPVYEYTEYLEDYGLDNHIDIIYQLQHFSFNEPQPWTEKIEASVKCESMPRFKRSKESHLFYGSFWNHDVYAKKAECMALRGQASTLSSLLSESNFRSILFDRAEVILWDNYGGPTWWAARKSLVFAKHLKNMADEFLHISNLTSSKTTGSGQEYIGVHLRRSDFLLGGRQMPTIKGVVSQLLKLTNSLSLSVIFLATDTTESEKSEFREHLSALSKSNIKVMKYKCPDIAREGECAIIDQIVCSHSKYFIGTEESTFTFRIFEEREIMGFDPITNFNYLCPNSYPNCKKATEWRIKR